MAKKYMAKDEDFVQVSGGLSGVMENNNMMEFPLGLMDYEDH